MAMPPDEPIQQPNAPATTVIVEGPAPAPQADDETDSDNENAQALAEVSGRVDAIETRITAEIEGERNWTQSQIAPLLQELADLKANSKVQTENFLAQITALQDTLTRLQQEPVEEVISETLSVTEPPETPPDPNNHESAEDQGVPTSSQPWSQSPHKKSRKRVV
jgi:hypothetical protein